MNAKTIEIKSFTKDVLIFSLGLYITIITLNLIFLGIAKYRERQEPPTYTYQE